MELRWFGQSAFLLRGAHRVAIDPFCDPSVFASRGRRFGYPPIADVDADLLLVTHEHPDHNGVDAITGAPVVIRSRAGTFDAPIGEVIGVASEHDEVAGTARGANTIFRFALDGVSFCHLGDLGQPGLRPEQREAIGEVDVLMIPVGGQLTIGAGVAAAVVREIGPRTVIPMHYRTAALDFLEPADAFLAAAGIEVREVASDRVTVEEHLGTRGAPRAIVLSPPAA